MQSVSDGPRWMLRLRPGEALHDTLSEFAHARGIRAAAVVMGIGMLRSATFGFWNGREYDPRESSEPLELIALHGSIAEVDGAPSVHLHAAATNARHETLSGHLIRGTIGILGELYVETFPGRVFGRPLDETLGLRTLDLEPGPAP